MDIAIEILLLKFELKYGISQECEDHYHHVVFGC